MPHYLLYLSCILVCWVIMKGNQFKGNPRLPQVRMLVFGTLITLLCKPMFAMLSR